MILIIIDLWSQRRQGQRIKEEMMREMEELVLMMVSSYIPFSLHETHYSVVDGLKLLHTSLFIYYLWKISLNFLEYLKRTYFQNILKKCFLSTACLVELSVAPDSSLFNYSILCYSKDRVRTTHIFTKLFHTMPMSQ